LRPSRIIAIRQIFLGDLADGLVRADDDSEILAVGRLRGAAAAGGKHRQRKQDGPQPLGSET
jgi:hypothetical protein